MQVADATNSAPWEVTLSAEDYKKLNVEEGALLAKADNLVALGKWPAAVVYYEQIHNDFRPGNLQEANYARSRLLYYYTQVRSNVDQALALANELVKVPGYAKDTYLIRAGLYREKKMYIEAIGDYMLADQPPGTFFAIAECYVEWGKPSMAITQLSEIESFFAAEAPEAALRIAYVWRDAHDQPRYIAALRALINKYPKSTQAQTARQLLAGLGVDRNGPGVNERGGGKISEK
ncbi:MAG: tetratricopeptide repeat protein [Kiritimatiellia bacterium]